VNSQTAYEAWIETDEAQGLRLQRTAFVAGWNARTAERDLLRDIYRSMRLEGTNLGAEVKKVIGP
jgi:hypothetical protein